MFSQILNEMIVCEVPISISGESLCSGRITNSPSVCDIAEDKSKRHTTFVFLESEIHKHTCGYPVLPWPPPKGKDVEVLEIVTGSNNLNQKHQCVNRCVNHKRHIRLYLELIIPEL